MDKLLSIDFQPGVQAKILVISDNVNHTRLWCDILNRHKIDAIYLDADDDVLQQWANIIPDLILIDKYSDEFDGISLINSLRTQSVIPILLLTPQNNETQILEAYQAGTDECVVKPLGPPLFLAKVNSWLRRTWSMPTESLDDLKIGGLQLNPTHRHVVTDQGEMIKLTNLEFRLLHLLMGHQGWILSTEDIILKVWGYYGSGDSNLLKNLVYRLRRKIDPDQNNPRYIHTEAGIGYRFQDTSN